MQIQEQLSCLFRFAMVRPWEKHNYFICQSYMYLHVFKKWTLVNIFGFGGSSNIPTANLIGSHSSKSLKLVYILVSGENSNVPYCNLKMDLQFIKSLNPCLIILASQNIVFFLKVREFHGQFQLNIYLFDVKVQTSTWDFGLP